MTNWDVPERSISLRTDIKPEAKVVCEPTNVSIVAFDCIDTEDPLV